MNKMKLIVNENCQIRGMHRAGVTLTVSESMLRAEIKKGRHPIEKRGRHPWMSGLMEHCTPANQQTADFIEHLTKEKIKPIETDDNEKDDSDEIRGIRADFDLLGKAYDKRWQLKRLRSELIKAKKAVGEVQNSLENGETIIEE